MRFVWIIAGSVFLVIGVVGVILPMVPGTVFLLVASACYLRGSKRLHDWLMGHPILGHHVRIMTGEVAMPMRSKIAAVSAMWIAVTISLLATKILALQIVLAGLALFGTWFIARRR